jgi:hypothetical protein
VQLASVCLTRGGGPLARAVEEVPDDLVGDQQSEQARVASARQDREQRGAVGLVALVAERAQRVLAERVVGDLTGERAPPVLLARDGR